MRIISNKKIKAILKFAKFIFLIFFIYISFNYFKSNLAEFKNLLNITPRHLTVLSILTILNLIITGIIFNTIYSNVNKKLTSMESIGLSTVNNMTNYLFFKGGLIIRAYYLKKNYGTSIKRYIRVILEIAIVQFVGTSFVLLAVLFVHLGNAEQNVLQAFYFKFAGIILIIIFILFNYFKLIKKPNNKAINFNLFKKHYSYSLKKVFFSFYLFFIWLLVHSLKIYMLFLYLSKPITFSFAIILSCTGVLASFLAITPAAIGIREFLMSSVASLSGGEFTVTALASSLDRAIIVFWVFVIGISFSLFYFKSKNQTLNN